MRRAVILTVLACLGAAVLAVHRDVARAAPPLVQRRPTTATTRSASQPATKPATRPTFQELLRKKVFDDAPLLSDQNPSLSSFDVSGVFGQQAGSNVRFRVCYRAPDRRALYAYHAFDGTPLAVAAGGRLVVYDALNARLLAYDDVRPTFFFRAGEKTIDMKWGFNNVALAARLGSPKEPEPGVPPGFTVDLASVMKHVFYERRVERWEGEHFKFVAEGLGGRVRGVADVRRWQPYVELLVVPKRTEDPFALIDHLEINETLPDELFAAPDLSRAAGRIGVVPRRTSGLPAEVEKRATRELTSAVISRAAMYDVGVRKQWPDALGKVDWDESDALDRAAAPIVRDVLGTFQPPPRRPTTTATTRPVKTYIPPPGGERR